MSEPQNVIPLTDLKVQQIITAVARLKELSQSTIITPDTARNEAEILGLHKFLVATMLENGPELVGCWVAVRTEYEPLVQVIERISERVRGIQFKKEMNRRIADAATEQDKTD